MILALQSPARAVVPPMAPSAAEVAAAVRGWAAAGLGYQGEWPQEQVDSCNCNHSTHSTGCPTTLDTRKFG